MSLVSELKGDLCIVTNALKKIKEKEAETEAIEIIHESTNNNDNSNQENSYHDNNNNNNDDKDDKKLNNNVNDKINCDHHDSEHYHDDNIISANIASAITNDITAQIINASTALADCNANAKN